MLLLTGILPSALPRLAASGTFHGTVYIRPDGSIDPPDAPIFTADNVTYVLTSNMTSDADGIVVERNNIVLYGAGCTVKGTGIWPHRGVNLSWRMNVTVKNLRIEWFWFGIYLYHSSYNSICENNMTNNRCGIYLYCSLSNSISGNTFVNNGLFIWRSYENLVVDNFVNGKPLAYLEGVFNYKVEDAGQVILVKCSNVTVENLNLFNATVGVQLWETINTKVTGNSIVNNRHGVWLYYSSGNSIHGNSIANNNRCGISLFDCSSNNSIYENDITNTAKMASGS